MKECERFTEYDMIEYKPFDEKYLNKIIKICEDLENKLSVEHKKINGFNKIRNFLLIKR